MKYGVYCLGLRTLCCAVADIPEEFYDDWKHTYYKASTSIQERERKLEEAAELIETVFISLFCFALFFVFKVLNCFQKFIPSYIEPFLNK